MTKYQHMIKDVSGKTWRRMRKTSMIIYTIIAAILGVGVGLLFSWLEAPELLVFWFGFPGTLFIRALTLVVVPLVFCSVVLGVVGIANVGGSIGKLALWTSLLYALTTTVGVIEGLIFVQSFRFAWGGNEEEKPSIYCEPSEVYWDNSSRVSIINTEFFDTTTSFFNSSNAAFITLEFYGENELTNIGELVYNAEQTISFMMPDLVPVGSITNFNVYNSDNSISFNIPNGSLTVLDSPSSVNSESSGAGQSVSDSISNLFLMLVPRNALGTFVGNAENSANLLGMIMFAIMFGVCSSILKRKNKLGGDHLIESIKQVLLVISYFTDKLMYLTPFAVFSLITEAFGSQTLKELGESMQSLGILFATVIMAFLFHLFVFLGAIMFAFTRENIFKHFYGVIPALNIAFACASSASTLPTTMECANKLGMTETVSKFVLSLGATINMDGNSIFQPAIMMWLANSAGINVSISDQIIICVVAALASMGSSPAPGLTPAVILVWAACFPSYPVPDSIAYVLALDWLLDRCITTLNVAGDTVAARIVDHHHKKMVTRKKSNPEENNAFDLERAIESEHENDREKSKNRKEIEDLNLSDLGSDDSIMVMNAIELNEIEDFSEKQ